MAKKGPRYSTIYMEKEREKGKRFSEERKKEIEAMF